MKKGKKYKKIIKEDTKMDNNYLDSCKARVKEKMVEGREFYFETVKGRYLIKEFDEMNMKVLGEDDAGVTKWLYVTGYDFPKILKNIKPLRVRRKKVNVIKKLNNGRGAILCNNCRKIIREDLDIRKVRRVKSNLYCKECIDNV